MRSHWVKKIGELEREGDDVFSAIIQTDDGPMRLRALRCTAFEGLGVLTRGLAQEPRIAEVVPIRRKPRRPGRTRGK